LLEDLAENAEYVNESLLRSIPLEQYEMDELWTVIKKKQKKTVGTGRDESEEGDAWIYTAVKRSSYLFPAFSMGKLTQNTCRLMIYDFRRRVRPFQKEKIEVFTDGNDDYTYVLKSLFPMDNIN
jgi:IS1 family transposase